MNCCGCEISKTKRVVKKGQKNGKGVRKKRRMSRKQSITDVVNTVSPFHRSLVSVRTELSRKNIDHTKLKLESLVFVDPSEESLFRIQWRWYMKSIVPWFSVLVVAALVVKYLMAHQYGVSIAPSLLGIVPAGILFVLSTFYKDKLLACYDEVLCIVLLCICISVSFQNHTIRESTDFPKDAPDCNSHFPSPYVKVMVWFAALGLQVRFRYAMAFGVLASLIELGFLYASLHQLMTIQTLLASAYSMFISLFYGIIHSYRVELSYRRNFLMVNGAWNDLESKKKLLKEKIKWGCLWFKNPDDERQFDVYTRFKRTKYVRRKYLTALMPSLIVLVLFYFVRLMLNEYRNPTGFYSTVRNYNCSQVRGEFSFKNCTYVDTKNTNYVTTRFIYSTQIWHLFSTYVPICILCSVIAIFLTTKYKNWYKSSATLAKYTALMILVVAPTVNTMLWMLAFALTKYQGNTKLFDVYVPYRTNFTKKFSVKQWNDHIADLQRGAMSDQHAFFQSGCEMYGVEEKYRCDFQVFEIIQNFCSGTATMHNYLCWLLQLMCLLLVPRIISSIGAVLLVATFHFSINAGLDGLYPSSFFRDLPLFFGAIVVMVQQAYTYQENFLARQIDTNNKKFFTGMVENPLKKVLDSEDYTLPPRTKT